ncbi:MAG TPA: DNA repair protein, partial [Labilithrix sp.]
GNPYTETGARFQIPDMLANRADTYNLGDILGGQEELFASSYLENALTSNPVLAPLASRDAADVQKLVRIARGEDVPLTDLQHGYAAAEVEEIVAVLRHMLTVQKLLLRVNLEYIRSASQEDAFRTEPPFKLQGSYRNMNKLAEKIVSAMNADELERLVDDHYQSESQTLTTGAEQNLLKLAELRGRMSEEQKKRWQEIKDGYVRNKRSGGKGDDPVARVTGALGGVDEQLQKIGKAIDGALTRQKPAEVKPPNVEVRIDTMKQGDAVVAILREHTKAVEKVVAALAEAAKQVPRRSLTPPLGAVAPPPPGSIPPPPPASLFAGEKLDELVTLVKRLEQRLASASLGSAAAPRFEVVLDGSSASNFYRGFDGDAPTGVFVATYAKVPRVGTSIVLALEFPGGVRCEVAAEIAFVQDELGAESPAGFGAKLTSVPEDAVPVIAHYIRVRDPLVRE